MLKNVYSLTFWFFLSKNLVFEFYDVRKLYIKGLGYEIFKTILYKVFNR